LVTRQTPCDVAVFCVVAVFDSILGHTYQLARQVFIGPKGWESSDKRLARITQHARGFIYAVSRAGVTGARDEMTRDAEDLVKHVRLISDLPIAVGFGISTAEQVRAVWRFADAAVVGSAIVSEIERFSGKSDLVNRIGKFVASLNKPL